jgi:oligopeptide transport system substrate-binding protein
MPSGALWHATRQLLPLVLLGILAGCTQNEPNVASGNREGILYFGNGTEPQSLDPHIITSSTDSKIASALFEGLVTVNPDTLEIEPGVAERWAYSTDRKIITFHLNPRARWSNDDPLTSEDFRWSLQRVLTPAMGNQLNFFLFPIVGAEEFAKGINPDPASLGITTPNEHTLVIELNKPVPYFLAILASYFTYPVHRETIESHGDWTARYTQWTRPENFVGNGAFTLEDWSLYRQLVTRKNPRYWDADNVALNGIVFKPVENIHSEEKMFRVGQLHYTSQVPTSKIPVYRKLPNTPYREAPLLGTYYYMFNIHKSPVDDVRVRRALALSVNRQQLIAQLLHGSAEPSPGLTPEKLIPGYAPPDLLRYNPEQARRLMAEAGYPGGAGFPPLELLFNTSDDHRKVAVAVQQMWKDELGISVTLANQEWKVYLDTTDEGHFQLARMGWIGGFLDPTTFLDTMLSTSPVNRTGFSDPRYDEIILRDAPAELDPAKRMALLQEAETIMIEQVPLIPFYTYKSRHLVQPSVSGLGANVFDTINFKYISLDPTVEPFNYRD